MKVLAALYQYHPYGGLQKDAYRLFEELAQRGHQVNILTTKWQGEVPCPDLVHLELVSPPRFRSNHGRMAWFAKCFQKRLNDNVAGVFDVSIALNRIPGADFYFAADVCMKSYWGKIHSALTCRLIPRYRTYLALEQGIFSPCSKTKIACLVPAQIADYRLQYHTQKERFFLLPPGTDTNNKRPDELSSDRIRTEKRTAYHVSPDEIVVVMVGNSIYNKGIDRSIETIGNLPAKWKKKVRLWIIGGLPQKKLEMLLNQNQLTEQAEVLGQINGIRDYFLAADLMLHPARNEATGTVLIESIAVGTPVITTDICGFSNYVSESGNDVLVSPYSANTCLQTLIHALENLEPRKKKTLEYGVNADFYSRAKVLADAMENFIKDK